jgi:predicted Zn-dependent protease
MVSEKEYTIVEKLLQKYTQRAPKDPNGWLNLAAAQMALNKRAPRFHSLQKAIEYGGEPVREYIQKDRRFSALKNLPEYKKLIPPTPQIPQLPALTPNF